MNLNKIAKEISQLDEMPYDAKQYHESCYLVARNVYELNEKNATKVADIIQEKYLVIK